MSAIANSNHPEDQNKTPKIHTKIQSFWQSRPWQKLTSVVVAIALCFALTACGGSNKPATTAKVINKPTDSVKFTEVSPPSEIQRLSRLLDRYAPQVSILSPKPNEVLTETEVAVKFDVKDLPIFKSAEFGLGPHIHVALDNQEYKAVYDLSQAATFTNLSPGTHTVRAFASRPWHESFKNQGAYAQVSFNVLTKTDENNPDPQTPLLTYSRPVGSYGAEPIMLDFYIQNAPLHLLAQEDPAIDDWQIRATIDDQSFTFDRWEPIYLKGFKEGKNWVKLELIEEDGDAIANVYNSTAHLINYQPNGTDTLSRLVSGEKIANIEAIVDPNYVPPAPVETPAPVSNAPESAPESVPAVAPTEALKEVGKKESAPEVAKEPAKPEVAIAKPEEKPTTSVIPVIPAPVASPKVIAAPKVVSPAPITPTNPALVKSSPAPTKPSVKVAPTSTQPKSVEKAPIAAPAKPSEKVLPTTLTNPKNVAPAKDAPKEQPEQSKAAKVAPKADVKSEVKTEIKTEVNPTGKTTETLPPLTDLSASSSTPVKVIK